MIESQFPVAQIIHLGVDDGRSYDKDNRDGKLSYHEEFAGKGLHVGSRRPFSSKHLDRFRNEEFDYIITVCDNAAENCPVFPGEGLRFHWPFNDPARAVGSEEDILNEFRRVRDEISEKISHWLSLAPESYLK